METFPFWWVIHCVALLQYFDENIGGTISIPIDSIAGVDIKSQISEVNQCEVDHFIHLQTVICL